jgi:hypothetical protein
LGKQKYFGRGQEGRESLYTAYLCIASQSEESKERKGISWEGRIEVVTESYTLWGLVKSGLPAISDHVPDRGRQDDGQGWTRWTSPVVMGIELCISTIMVFGTGLLKN